MEARYACPTCPVLCVRGFAFDERIEFEEKTESACAFATERE